MLTITKTFEFAYGHHLPEYEGKCKNPHGHTGILEVEISGCPGVPVYQGMVYDFGDLKKVVNDLVISQFDHKYLNDFLERPTAENMTLWIVRQLQAIFGDSLIRIRVYETPTSYAEWRKH